MKRTFVSHWIFPLLRTVSLPSRKTRVELELCEGRGGAGPASGAGIPCRELGGSAQLGGFIKLRPTAKAAPAEPPDLQNQVKPVLHLWGLCPFGKLAYCASVFIKIL